MTRTVFLPAACALLVGPTAGDAQSPRLRLAIAAQDIAQALRAFARASGRQVAFDTAEVGKRRSRAVTGIFSPEEALRRIIAGSGLVFARGAAGIFIVTRAPQAASPPPTTRVIEDQTPADIVVTARKREERAVDVPIALSAVSGEALERRGVRNLSDFLQEAPGVGIYDYGNGVQKITIRGISTSLGANENGYYLDDLPFTGVTVPIAPDVRAWDLDRVEVLRGPQGTLFGEGSLGGTVRILTKGADLNDWEAKGSTYVSDTEDGGTNRGIKGAFNAPIVPGVLAVRIAGTAEKLPGWIDDATTGRRNLNDQSFTTFRAKARFDPTDRLTINGSYWYYNGSFPGGGASATDDGQQSRSIVLDSGTKYRLYGGSARYDLGGAELFYGYSHNKLDLPQEGPFLGGTLISTIGITVDAHEARIASSGSGPLQWTLGGYARDAKRNDVLSFALFGLDNTSETTSKARALFGEGTYTLPFAPIDLTAGLRYYHERLRGFETNAGIVTDQPGDTYESWNPRFSVAWHPVANTTLYASAAKGFRAGQLQPTVSASLAAPLGITLPPALGQDSIWTYELGGKAELFNRLLTVEAAVYYSDWKDVTVRIPIGTTGFNGLINSNGTITKGAELNLVLKPVTGLSLAANGSYNDATYSGAVAGTGIVKGAQVDDVAKFTANMSADYRREIVTGVSGFGRIGWQHTSPRRFVSFPGYLPGDTIDRIDARFGVDLDRLTIAAFFDNLTDDRGATSFRTVQPIAPGDNDITAFRLRPRTIGLELTARFGGSAR
ncbi:TonB-dependent receptor domain-containing protein [Sphingomonas sp. CLY1604]|uniref:TonB-dependent receptor domain-containing protein n=1 Tax=Sphingomonas sp. CLY1604 TaxID=3457786 RepID=UPI003FD7EC21